VRTLTPDAKKGVAALHEEAVDGIGEPHVSSAEAEWCEDVIDHPTAGGAVAAGSDVAPLAVSISFVETDCLCPRRDPIRSVGSVPEDRGLVGDCERSNRGGAAETVGPCRQGPLDVQGAGVHADDHRHR